MKIKKKTIVLVLILPPLTFFISLYIHIPKGRLNPASMVSFRLMDRNNILLREVLSAEGGHCHWVRLEEISPHLPKATVVAEDKHFFLHPGVNFLAIARAFIQNIRSGRIVSGASTITQQLVRNTYHVRRNVFSKIYEAWLALRMENTLSKDEILTQYLNRVCYGNQAYGIEAASRLYFDKPSSHLSLAEAAFLAGLPRSPSYLNPYRSFDKGKKRQREILERMYSQSFITQDELERALEEKLNLISEKDKFRAPHFCDYILNQISSKERTKLSAIQTTLDYTLQEKVDILVKSHLKTLETHEVSNAAVIVLNNTTGEILCMIGSKDFFDYRHDGQVNGAVSLRQPGSTLKPFTYALALENGMTAATILEDVETQFMTPQGSYIPQNYDKKFHGPIRMRSALACSYNVPATSALQSLGSDLLYQRLKRLGFESLRKSPSFYGIGLTLGNGEVTLLELVSAYSTLARQGLFIQEKSILKAFDVDNNQVVKEQKSTRIPLFTSQVAYIITHILADRDARIPSFGYNSPLSLPFPCASKTGTSKDFRDNWTIGYTPRYTVGVWVGNFDGKPMQNVSGITGCGPLFKDIMLFLEKKKSGGAFKEPEKLIWAKICPLSGKLPTASCPGIIEEIFIEGTEPQDSCFFHQKIGTVYNKDKLRQLMEKPLEEMIAISFPVNGDIFKIDPILRKKYQTIKFKAHVPEEMGVDKIEWWLNNQKIGVSEYPFSLSWNLKPGFHTIRASARKGKRMIKSRPIKITVFS